MANTKMILPFMLGRSAGGRAVTTSSDIDAGSGKSQAEVNEAHAESLARIEASDKAHHSSRFDAIFEGSVICEQSELTELPELYKIFWHKNGNCFILRTGSGQNVKFYDRWKGMDEYNDPNTGNPYLGKQYIFDNKVYMYHSSSERLVEIGSTGTSGIFNVTNAVPINGFYVLCDAENTDISAVHAAWAAEKAVSGLIISFEISAGIWKTYQYIGKTLSSQNWFNIENWKDFGSLAAGSETYIIIDNLIGPPVAGGLSGRDECNI